MGFVPSQLAPQVPVPILIFPLGAGAPSGCTPNKLANTDVVVIRRFNTESTAIGSVNANQIYVQVSECATDSQATPYLVDTGANAANLVLKARGCTTAIANAWQFREQLYYVRDYSVNVGDGIPTLVRMELGVDPADNTLKMMPNPLVEGIENLRVDLGLDTNSDGTIDAWRRCEALTPCSAADYSNVLAAKVYVLSRTLDQTREYTDDKTYDLGMSGTTTATGDHYKRHVYSALIGMPNRSGPREPILAS
jgi:type IV pilus assembly protein PilW